MTLQFKLGPRNQYGQAQVFIAPALSRTFQNVGQISVSPEEWQELQSRLTQPQSSEREEETEDAPTARYQFDDLSVALTRSDLYNSYVAHFESLSSDPDALLLLRVTANELNDGPEPLWEGSL